MHIQQIYQRRQYMQKVVPEERHTHFSDSQNDVALQY